MKITKLLVLVLACEFALTGVQVQAQVATKVNGYTVAVSMPDVTQLDFGTQREYQMAQMERGLFDSTQSRVGRTTGIELRNVCEVGDMVVSTNQIWRGVFNDPSYPGMTGCREYVPLVFVGIDGQVSISRIEYVITCQNVPSLGNSSSLNGLSYSTSRRGVNKGLDGKLWTPDDVIVSSGSGTNLVDAVVFIGGRIGAVVNNQSDISYLNGQITTNGTPVVYEYRFNSPAGMLNTKHTIMLYPQGGIPYDKYCIDQFKMPVGRVFSVVGPQGVPPFVLKSTRNIDQPWALWKLENAAATEGSSAFLSYLGDLNPDRGYAGPLGSFVVTNMTLPTLVSLAALELDHGDVISSPSSDPDQDR